jgi:hypothetical protein
VDIADYQGCRSSFVRVRLFSSDRGRFSRGGLALENASWSVESELRDV